MNLLTKFRSEIDQVLINKDDTQSPKISKSLIQEGDLTSKEKEILEYIRLNPGITKQQIVNHFGQDGLGKYSRVTTFKTISYLQRYSLIVVSLDQNNSQIHHLYTNNESTLSLLIQDIETFKNAFFLLLNKAKEKYAEFEEEKTTVPSELLNKVKEKYPKFEVELTTDPSADFDLRSSTMSVHLFHIYRYFIDVNIIRILFSWSRTEDPQISAKTAPIFFNEIKEIQLKLSEAMEEVKDTEDQYKFIEFADFLFSGHDRISEFLVSLFEFFTHWYMEEEIRKMLYCLLKLHSSLLPIGYTLLELKVKGIILKEFNI